MRKLPHFACCLLSSAVLAAGCAKARAQTVPDGPPLSMPSPPPRVFVPVDEEPLAAGPVAPETPAIEAPQVPAGRPPRRAAAAVPEREKPEPAPPPTPVPEPPRELRPSSTPADAQADRKIQAMLQVATRNLGQVDYQRLSVAGREQYDQAKTFGEQAQQALTQRNYVFAETLADKAVKLATELLGGRR